MRARLSGDHQRRGARRPQPMSTLTTEALRPVVSRNRTGVLGARRYDQSVSEDQSAPEVSEPIFDAAPLSRPERFWAGVAGVTLAGSGGVAVFLSSNQAGTVALLLGGVLLLLMAINGAPLIRARYQEYELLMARRRREVAAAATQEEPEEAQRALRVLSDLDPGASRDPLVARASAYAYERQMVERLQHLFPDLRIGQRVSRMPGMRLDAVMETPDGSLGVEIKAGQGVLPNLLVRQAIQNVPPPAADAVLLITNRVLPTHIDRRVRDISTLDARPLRVVRWVDEQDDAALIEAVRALRLRMGREGTPPSA